MILGSKKFISAFLILFASSFLFSQDLRFLTLGLNTTVSDIVSWTTTTQVPTDKTYSYSISMPFTFPAESNLHPLVVPSEYLKTSHITILPHFSIGKASIHSVGITRSTDSEQNFFIPSALFPIRSNHFFSQTSSIVFFYLNKKVGLDFDFSFRMMGASLPSHNPIDLQTRITLSYRIANNLVRSHKDLSLYTIMRLSGYTSDKPILLEDAKKHASAITVSPGFRVKAKNFTVEGLLQMPVHYYDKATWSFNDSTANKEIQGRLGMSWFLPEYIKPE